MMTNVRLQTFHFAENGDPVHSRKIDVEQDELRIERSEALESIFSG